MTMTPSSRWLALALLALSACGGGGTDAATADPANSAVEATALAAPALRVERLARGQEQTMCALPAGRTGIVCWGNIGAPANPLITGPLTNGHALHPTPIGAGDIPAGSLVAKVALGLGAACALTDDGAAYCWGENQRGVLGLGSAVAGSAVPRRVAAGQVPPGVRLVDIAASAWTVCAAGDDGRLYCWGANTTIPNPALPSTGFSSAPVATAAGAMPAGVKGQRVALGTNVGCTLGSDGAAYCWKVGAITPARVLPGAVPASVRLTEVQVGSDLACALADNGEAYCWGSAPGYRFGAGSTAFTIAAAPVAVAAGARPAGVRLVALSVGGGSTASCATGSDGHAWCWGRGYRGSLADGNLVQHDALVPAAVLDGDKPAASGWRTLNCATYTCSALAADGVVYQWGANESLMLTRANPPLIASATPLAIAP